MTARNLVMMSVCAYRGVLRSGGDDTGRGSHIPFNLNEWPFILPAQVADAFSLGGLLAR